MSKNNQALGIYPSFGFQLSKGSKYGEPGINMWHPGYAWACTQKAYTKMGGLYEKSILGAGDHTMTFSFIGNGIKSVNEFTTEDYKQSVLDFEQRVKNLRIGYVPGVIRHHFHGSKKNRKYSERWQILVNNSYMPTIHITKNKDGLLVPSKSCPKQMLDDIMTYFLERNEDEGYAAI